jgi:membrane-bound serine protease (ClpP class)
LISLILGFAGIGNLPFSWAALALLALAVLFYVLEALNPGVGLFGAFGTVALVLGGLFMLGVTGPPAFPGDGLHVNRWLPVTVGAVALLLVVLLAREFRLSHRQVYVSPYARERLLGELAEVSVRLAPRGEVRLAGEFWSAELRGAATADVGERVRVTDLSQLGLLVEPAESRESETTESIQAPEPGR